MAVGQHFSQTTHAVRFRQQMHFDLDLGTIGVLVYC